MFSEEIKTLFKLRPAGVATVDRMNRPDVETSPVIVYNDKTLVFPEFDEESKTLKNLRGNPEVAVLAWSGKLLLFGRNKAYKFRGKAEIHEDGPFFSVFKEKKPKFVVSVRVEKMFYHDPEIGFWVRVE